MGRDGEIVVRRVARRVRKVGVRGEVALLARQHRPLLGRLFTGWVGPVKSGGHSSRASISFFGRLEGRALVEAHLVHQPLVSSAPQREPSRSGRVSCVVRVCVCVCELI